MIPCPSCKGTGKVSAFACPGFVLTELKCYDCLGAGEITEGHQEAKEHGERMRLERIARQVSLRDEAARLDISPRELSDIEHGRME